MSEEPIESTGGMGTVVVPADLGVAEWEWLGAMKRGIEREGSSEGS